MTTLNSYGMRKFNICVTIRNASQINELTVTTETVVLSLWLHADTFLCISVFFSDIQLHSGNKDLILTGVINILEQRSM